MMSLKPDWYKKWEISFLIQLSELNKLITMILSRQRSSRIIHMKIINQKKQKMSILSFLVLIKKWMDNIISKISFLIWSVKEILNQINHLQLKNFKFKQQIKFNSLSKAQISIIKDLNQSLSKNKNKRKIQIKGNKLFPLQKFLPITLNNHLYFPMIPRRMWNWLLTINIFWPMKKTK